MKDKSKKTYCKDCGKAKVLPYKKKSQCSKCYRAEYHKINKEKENEQAKQWTIENKEKKTIINNKFKQKQPLYDYNWELKNKQQRIKYRKQYYIENREEIIQKTKLFIQSNPTYIKKYRRKNRYKLKAYKAARRVLIQNSFTSFFKKEIQEVYNTARQLEKKDNIKRYVHHIIPLREFNDLGIYGLHAPWNLQIVTYSEHLQLHKDLRKQYRFDKSIDKKEN